MEQRAVPDMIRELLQFMRLLENYILWIGFGVPGDCISHSNHIFPEANDL